MNPRFRRQPPNLGAWVVGLLFVLPLGFSAAPAAGADKPVAPAPLPIEQMRAVAYTGDFAKRFALPDPEPGTEPSGGIQAMEFAVEPGPKHGRGLYYCKLKLYLDNALLIAYPEEGIAGAEHMLRQSSHFFMWPNPENKRWLALSEKDRLHFNGRNGRYNRMTMLASPGYDYPEFLPTPPKTPYGGIDMVYEEYHRDLFPGVAYLKIDMGCPVFSWMNGIKTAEVWLKREGAKDYRKQIRMEPQDFLKFTIPPKMYQQILGLRKEVAAYNRPLIEKLGTERRGK